MPNAVGDVYEVTFIQSLHGQQLNTVRHYDVRTVVSGAVNTPSPDVEAAIAAAQSDVVDAMKLLLSNEWALTAVKVQRVKPVPRTAGVIATALAGNGTAASSSLPSTCCAVIRFRTAFAGVRYRGRNFIGGIPVASEEDSKITAGFQVQLGALAFQMVQSINVNAGGNAAGIVLGACLYGRKLATVTDITSWDVDRILRVQRRREVGKGV